MTSPPAAGNGVYKAALPAVSQSCVEMAHCSSRFCRTCPISSAIDMEEQAETRSKIELIPVPADQQKEALHHLTPTTRTIVSAVVIILVWAFLVVVMRLILRNPAGARSEAGQVHPPTGPGNGPRTTRSLAGECIEHKIMKTLSGSVDYCKSQHSRLLTEQDTKRASCQIPPREDFWAAPENRTNSDCFIYNTDHGFVAMDCRTLRWFICVKT